MKTKKKKLVIAGGTGFVGRSLCKQLAPHFEEVVVLTRKLQKPTELARFVQWNGLDGGNWQQELEGADLLINLCGKSVDCRYTDANKQEILDSRVQTTLALGAACIAAQDPPRMWMNAASATIYAHEELIPQTEENGIIGNGFSVDVCTAWEGLFNEVPLTTTKKVTLRMALVLGDHGGVWERFCQLTKWGLGGTMGKGTQIISWIHEEDLANAIIHIFTNQLEGVFNLSAPTHYSNREFMRLLRQQMNMKFGLPAGKRLLELGAKVIGTETELILKSRYVMPRRLLDSGYDFTFKALPAAMKELSR